MASDSIVSNKAARRKAESEFSRDVRRRIKAERWRNRVDLDWSCSVNSSGIELRAVPRSPSVRPPSVKRGKVIGFSRESANRLRERLRKLNYDDAFALCLTVPLYTGQSPEDAFKTLCRHLSRYCALAIVWRKEVTALGLVHYHLIVWPADGLDPSEVRSRLVRAWCNALFVGATVEGLYLASLRASLARALRRLTPRGVAAPDDDVLVGVDDYFADRPDLLAKLSSKWASRKGDVFALAIDLAVKVNMSERNFRKIESKDGYIRYILDHTSKHKAYQAKTVGRPWGVCGKPPVDADEDYDLSEAQGHLITRVLRKASRYRLHCPCVFGHKRAFGKRFASTASMGGRHVLFGVNMPLLVAWAREMRP